MATQVLEGTWEEITRHAKDFVGRKVRITVLDDEAAPKPNQKSRKLTRDEEIEVLNRIGTEQREEILETLSYQADI